MYKDQNAIMFLPPPIFFCGAPDQGGQAVGVKTTHTTLLVAIEQIYNSKPLFFSSDLATSEHGNWNMEKSSGCPALQYHDNLNHFPHIPAVYISSRLYKIYRSLLLGLF